MHTEKLNLYLERLDEVFQRMARYLHAELAQSLVSGITMSQFVVLRSLEKKGKVTVSEVAEDLNVSLSAITALADRLYKAGLVDRRRDEQDRRLVWLTLTGKGVEAVAACRKARMKVVGKYFEQLPAEDVERLIQIYEKILAVIKAEN